MLVLSRRDHSTACATALALALPMSIGAIGIAGSSTIADMVTGIAGAGVGGVVTTIITDIDIGTVGGGASRARAGIFPGCWLVKIPDSRDG